VRADESEELLLERWPAVEQVVSALGGEPATDLARAKLVVVVRAISRPAFGTKGGDLYVMRLVFDDYDEHAPRIWFCNPADPTQLGHGQQFYPKLEGNGSGVFAHAGFLCMPGDRRCYEAGHHAEWRRKEYFHPDVVIGHLLALVKSPNYRGRL
jgi:hypothetical protein